MALCAQARTRLRARSPGKHLCDRGNARQTNSARHSDLPWESISITALQSAPCPTVNWSSLPRVELRCFGPVSNQSLPPLSPVPLHARASKFSCGIPVPSRIVPRCACMPRRSVTLAIVVAAVAVAVAAAAGRMTFPAIYPTWSNLIPLIT